jgi:hypothetical protein
MGDSMTKDLGRMPGGTPRDLRPARWLLALAATVALCGASAAQNGAPYRHELFDAHVHYNQEPTPYYPLEKLPDVFHRNGVTGVLATSRPNKGTNQLVDAKPPGLWIVPFIRPYRVRADIQTWFKDPTIFDLIKDEYKRGYYRGVGEFHISGNDAAGPLVKSIVDFAVERDLYLHAHADDTAIEHLFKHNPRARIVWPHVGFSLAPSRVRELLDKYPALWGELSYRYGVADGQGKLSDEWRALFASHSDRFMIGSDTWINERWFSYDTIFKSYRAWLGQLPEDQARRIASGNAVKLFGPRPTN